MRIHKNVKTIGLTGGIGSGKSTIAKIFKTFDISIIDTDKISHEILIKNKTIRKKIVKVFGKEILKNGLINRKKLAEIVFSSHSELNKLEKILHPEILKEVLNKIKKSNKTLLIEVPLLFESGYDKYFDINISIKCPIKTRLKRAKNNHIKKSILKRSKYQLNEKERNKKSDFVLDNSKTLSFVEDQIKEIFKKIN